jgi:hypothetical protein
VSENKDAIPPPRQQRPLLFASTIGDVEQRTLAAYWFTGLVHNYLVQPVSLLMELCRDMPGKPDACAARVLDSLSYLSLHEPIDPRNLGYRQRASSEPIDAIRSLTKKDTFFLVEAVIRYAAHSTAHASLLGAQAMHGDAPARCLSTYLDWMTRQRDSAAELWSSELQALGAIDADLTKRMVFPYVRVEAGTGRFVSAYLHILSEYGEKCVAVPWERKRVNGEEVKRTVDPFTSTFYLVDPKDATR